MSYPEVFSLINEDQYIDAQATIDGELAHAGSAAVYLDQLLKLYSQQSPESAQAFDRPGEVLFQGHAASSEAQKLADTTRFIMLNRGEQLDPESDAFFRGTLLATHLVRTASDTERAGEASIDFYRKRLIRSAPWVKVVHEQPTDFEDVIDTETTTTLMPARDTTPQDELALSEDLLVRQTRISQAVQSRLFPYSGTPVIPERYEQVARSVASELRRVHDSFENNFMMGYRFIVKLYTDPDDFHRIVDTWNEYKGFKHIKNGEVERKAIEALETEFQATPEAERSPLDVERSLLMQELQDIQKNDESLDTSTPEAYRESLTEKLSLFADNLTRLKKGSLIEFGGVYNTVLRVVDPQEGTETVGEHTEGNESISILGVFDGVEVIEAPTEEGIEAYLESANESDLSVRPLVPALRIIEPQVFYKDGGRKLRFNIEKKYTYTLPVNYRRCYIDIHTFSAQDEPELEP